MNACTAIRWLSKECWYGAVTVQHQLGLTVWVSGQTFRALVEGCLKFGRKVGKIQMQGGWVPKIP